MSAMQTLAAADQQVPECEDRGTINLQALRKAIQANQVAFPSPVPIFACEHRADIQWRLVELYFVRGWSCAQLGGRYKVTDRRIQQLIQRWVARARILGYLQTLPPEELPAAAARVNEWQTAPDFEAPTIPQMPLSPDPQLVYGTAEGAD